MSTPFVRVYTDGGRQVVAFGWHDDTVKVVVALAFAPKTSVDYKALEKVLVGCDNVCTLSCEKGLNRIGFEVVRIPTFALDLPADLAEEYEALEVDYYTAFNLCDGSGIEDACDEARDSLLRMRTWLRKVGLHYEV